MRSWTKGVLGLAAFAAVTLVGVRAEAAYINVFDGCLEGSLSTVNCNGTRAGEADGTLTTSPEWAVNYLSWTVDFDPVTSFYRYTYNFIDGSPGSQRTSHSIVELSASFTTANLKAGSTCLESAIDTYTSTSHGNSNPSLPGTIYGISCGNPNDLNNHVVVLVTDRAPMWGDWYAKDGNPVHGYNTGALAADPTDAPSDGSINNHVLVPDTLTTTPQCPTFDCDVTVPEPVSLALFGLALTAAGVVKRRRRNS